MIPGDLPNEQIPPATTPRETPRTRRPVMDILLLIGILAVWIILQVWVLPKLGVPT
jgi:hypothetical protein